MDAKMTYTGRPWATLRLEASLPEVESPEVDEISAFSLTRFGLDGRRGPRLGDPRNRRDHRMADRQALRR